MLFGNNFGFRMLLIDTATCNPTAPKGVSTLSRSHNNKRVNIDGCLDLIDESWKRLKDQGKLTLTVILTVTIFSVFWVSSS